MILMTIYFLIIAGVFIWLILNEIYWYKKMPIE